MKENSLRFECIDIFRGLTIAVMLMVNNPGNLTTIPPQLKHASWNGVTIADLVFPFLFSSWALSCQFQLTIDWIKA
ncbi:hypothetical protein [Desulfosporosinus sp. OT]|uniref:hypothetical protein n=1 Tax=Desulfosporosinus sp. OT TaxID=913865 RepID=UPI00058ADE98|nr:hypothetical protein [Desulfosporosinus sp. OT]